eukprot:s3587_g11.t2
MVQQDIASQGARSSGVAGPAQEQANGLMQTTAKMPALSASCTGGTLPHQAAQLVGPPPKTRAPQEAAAADAGSSAVPILGPCASGGGDNQVISALAQQSQAITQLVAHLAGGGDAMADLATSSQSPGLGLNTKGVARREKMQSELAMRTSNYFMQVQQQLYKRMYPAKAVPRTVEELAQADVSMTAYLERYGGYKGARDTGLTMWIVAHAMDAAAMDDFHATKEYLALLAAALEQSALDGSWHVAYILSLMEEPPQQLFTERLQSVAAAGRPFSPLVPPTWAAVCLSYLKELEVLNTRKVEMKKPPAKQGYPAPDAGAPASPKRKPRFPKKPKAGAESP